MKTNTELLENLKLFLIFVKSIEEDFEPHLVEKGFKLYSETDYIYHPESSKNFDYFILYKTNPFKIDCSVNFLHTSYPFTELFLVNVNKKVESLDFKKSAMVHTLQNLIQHIENLSNLYNLN